MPWRIVIAAVAVLLVAGAAVALLAGGASADDEFRRQAIAACERQAEREAQRTYIGDPKRALEAHRERLTVFLTDLRKIEPSDKARSEWKRIVGIYEQAIRSVDEAQKKLSGKQSADRRILEEVESDVESVYAQPSSLFPDAGLPECDLPRSRTVKEANAFRFAASDACVRIVRHPLLPPLASGSRKAALKQLARMRKVTELGDPRKDARPPKTVEALYRKHMLDAIDKMLEDVDEARGRIGDRASVGNTFDQAVDDFNDFYSDYLDGAYTLRLDGCLNTQAELTRLETSFRRNARRACAPVARSLARAVDQKSLPALKRGVAQLEKLVRRLGKLRVSERDRGQWRKALRAARAATAVLDDLVDRATSGGLTATQADAYERRLTSRARVAMREMTPLGLPSCRRVFS